MPIINYRWNYFQDYDHDSVTYSPPLFYVKCGTAVVFIYNMSRATGALRFKYFKRREELVYYKKKNVIFRTTDVGSVAVKAGEISDFPTRKTFI